MGTVLIQLAEHLRMQARGSGPGPAPGLRHLSVFEEAHRLLRRPEEHRGGSGATVHAVEMFAGLLAEIRAYGEGLIIAEQIPPRSSPTRSRTRPSRSCTVSRRPTTGRRSGRP